MTDPRLAVHRRTLACGLDVIVHVDRDAPQVCVAVWYRAGSSDERADRSGLAHLVEHLFKNSAHMPAPHYEVLRRAGASDANASTGPDRTEYREIVPANELALALWLESDRMGYFLPGLDADRLAKQQAVVRAERRQRYEDVAYGGERLAVALALYPDGHPHRHLTIGTHEHIQAATVDDVADFYRTWYVPANAQLVIAGDVDLADTDALVDRYFGGFPRSIRPARRAPEPIALAAPVRVQLADRFAALARIHRAWHAPAAFADDEVELDIACAAWTQPGTGGLWRRLVYDSELAQRVAAWTQCGRLGGELHVAVDLRSGADPARVRAILDDECARPLEPVAIARQLVRREASAIWSLVTLVRRASLLHHFAMYTGEPDGLASELARYRAVTAASIAAALARWQRADRMVEVETVPAGGGAAGRGGAAAS